MARRKYCSAQPYLDYIGVSMRQRKEWQEEERRVKMSNEGKEFAWLETMIKSMEKVYGGHYAYYMKKDDIDKLKQLYRQLIQEGPK